MKELCRRTTTTTRAVVKGMDKKDLATPRSATATVRRRVARRAAKRSGRRAAVKVSLQMSVISSLLLGSRTPANAFERCLYKDALGRYRARGAPQPADFTVASLNFGFEQGAMTGKKLKTHRANFGRVFAKIVEEADADILFGCEVGGHRDGLHHVGVDLGDYLHAPFGNGVGYEGINNYWSVYRLGGAAHPANVAPASKPPDVDMLYDSYIYTLPGETDVDAVVTRFDVQTTEHGKVHVVVGNMHIVCGKNPPKIPNHLESQTLGKQTEVAQLSIPEPKSMK